MDPSRTPCMRCRFAHLPRSKNQPALPPLRIRSRLRQRIRPLAWAEPNLKLRMNFASPPRRSYVFQRHRARLAIGVTLSLMVHALIVSLQFGIPGLGLPGLDLPWNERRAQAPELSIRIANVRIAPSPTAVALSPEPVRTESALRFAPSAGARVTLPSQAPKSAAPTLRAALPPAATSRLRPRPRSAPLRSPTPVISKLEADPDSFVLPSASPEEPEPDPVLAAATPDEQPEVVDNTAAEVVPEVVPEITPEITPEMAPEMAPEIVPKIAPEIAPEVASEIALEIAPQAAPKVAAEKAPAALPDEPALQAKEQAAQLRKQEEAGRAQAIEAKKQDDANAMRLAAEAESREAHDQAERAAREPAVALALQRQAEQKRAEDDAAKRAQQLVARQQEEARQRQQAESEHRAAELEAEARKQAEESMRQQTAALDRQKKMDERAAREMTDREEANALAAQQRDRGFADSLTGDDSNTAPSSKAAVATVLPANLLGGLAGRALEQGRQLDLQPKLPPQPPKDARRRSMFGSVDQDIGVTMYIDSWRQKVERNGNMNYRPSAPDGAREDPVVTVSIRSDGSVEEIAIVRSSGLPEIDNAVRRIVGLYARYGAFPPDLARRYDVIEIRRIWRFDDKLRIREEMR